jgi:xanthine dehydrogenase accessory factor
MLAVNSANHYLGFQQLYFDLQSGKKGHYHLDIAQDGSHCATVKGQWLIDGAHNGGGLESETSSSLQGSAQPANQTPVKTKVLPITETDYPHAHRLVISVSPPIHVGIFGGGLDAQPLAQIAHNLGWKISVFDERTAYARSYDFPHCTVYKMPVDKVAQDVLATLDGAFIMNHNLSLDAKTLNVLVSQPLGYIALLGPAHRRDKVLGLAQLSVDDFNCYFSAPAGIALGGELPSSVALSMLAQCHGVLHQSQLLSLDKVMM